MGGGFGFNSSKVVLRTALYLISKEEVLHMKRQI